MRVGSFTTVCMGTPLIAVGRGTGGVSPKGVRELVAAGVVLERSYSGKPPCVPPAGIAVRYRGHPSNAAGFRRRSGLRHGNPDAGLDVQRATCDGVADLLKVA